MAAYKWKIRNSSSILHMLMLLFFVDGGFARMWGFSADMEIAEVVHRRHLQTATFCVAMSTADQTQLQTALNWACGTGEGNVDCSPLQQGGSCYTPNTLIAHASYAFDVYYTKQNGVSTACSFSGLAITTTTNPSNGTCVYPSFSGSTTPSSPTTPSPPGTPPTPPTSNNNNSTILSPTSSSSNFTSPTTTTGTTSNNAMGSSAITLPWIHIALCGVIAVMIHS